MLRSSMTAASSRNIQSGGCSPRASTSTFFWDESALSACHMSGRNEKPPNRTALRRVRAAESDGLNQNLRVSLRSDATPDSAFAHKNAALCLSFSRHPWRAAGKNLETSRLPARPRNGRNHSGAELDHLFVTETSHTCFAEEFEVPPGLHPNRSRP
jgi:hypothetical protein